MGTDMLEDELRSDEEHPPNLLGGKNNDRPTN